jgi:hypothetical protein
MRKSPMRKFLGWIPAIVSVVLVFVPSSAEAG